MKNLLNLIFPYYCANCHMLGRPLCQDCQLLIEYILEPSQKIIPHVNDSIVITKYSKVMENLITEFKFRFVKDISKTITQIIFQSQNSSLSKFFKSEIILVPVPLSKRKLRWRGFNQTEEICKEISKITNQKVVPLILKTKNTKSQSDLPEKERILNLKSCFSINKQSKVPLSTTICIIDDVITTGSTIKEVASVLFNYGYKNLNALFITGT